MNYGKVERNEHIIISWTLTRWRGKLMTRWDSMGKYHGVLLLFSIKTNQQLAESDAYSGNVWTILPEGTP